MQINVGPTLSILKEMSQLLVKKNGPACMELLGCWNLLLKWAKK